MSDALDSGASYDRGAADANNFLSQLDPRSRAHEPGSDPFLAGTGHASDFGNTIRLTVGKILTSLPYVNWYLVQLDDARSSKPGFKLTTDTGVQPMGVRESSPLPPNSQVLCFEHPSISYCGILGVLPPMLTDSNLVNPDWISQGSNTGFRREKYYYDLLTKLQQQGGIHDFSGNRPNDSTACAEWGRFSENGLGVFLDSFMAYLRADETTGFFAFYHDQLARVAGHNLDVRSAGHEITARDDEGEFQYFRGDTPYPHEAAGAFSRREQNSRETDDQGVMFTQPYGKYEPAHDDQQPFYRYREYGGYLGQGRMREVVLPPKESGLQRYQDSDNLVGVFREHVGLNGQMVMQTAKGIDIVKRCLIPAAKQIKLPEDERGDNRSGGYDHTQHKIGDLTGGDLGGAQSAALVADQLAHACNWQALHPFAYHHKDYHTPEESALTGVTRLHTSLDFDALKSSGWLTTPAARKLRVDARYGEVSYYENTAGISITDDGAVVLFDGYGGEIRLAGGNIQISCPGNVFLQPGKSLVALAGDDACIRAQQSAELTAGNKDLRLYARNNLQLLAQDGGLLLESRAASSQYRFDGKIGEEVESSGILLKSAHSPIVSWSQGLYLRTGGSAGEVDPGEIVLDADRGRQPLRTLSNRFERFVTDRYQDNFGIETPGEANVATRTGMIIASPLSVEQQLLVQGQATFGANVAIANGHLATEFAEQSSYMVAPLKDQALSQVVASLQAATQAEEQAVQQAQTIYNRHSAAYYDAEKPGNDTLQKQAGFSFRNEDQYGTNDFQLPESRWQQMARSGGGTGGVGWEEEPLEYQGNRLLPYPGYAAWVTSPSLLTVAPSYFDWGSGLDQARGATGGTYGTPRYADWSRKKPAGAYLTITDET